MMVSKEITKELIEYCKENEWWEVETKYLIEDLEKILKGLEVLEIFKDQFHINIYIGYFNGKPMYFLKIMGCDIFITKEIYNKLKEWLENDK